MNKIEKIFEKHFDEFLKFERVKNKKSNCPDLHGMILLEKLFPSEKAYDMICSGEHDRVWLKICEDQLDDLTDENVIELSRCGISYDEEFDSLTM